jgi:hypothetical protein
LKVWFLRRRFVSAGTYSLFRTSTEPFSKRRPMPGVF